jgi:formylglycine-generating enzyme required for sulfatase activity
MKQPKYGLWVFRGGSWFNDAVICRSAYRGNWFIPGYRNHNLGFRLAKEIKNETA